MWQNDRTGRLLTSLICISIWLASPITIAADLTDYSPALMPRYFPHGDGSDSPPVTVPGHAAATRCLPRQVIVPTNAPSDPSYVGSEYGLSKPSYYGFTPPRCIDDPYGRPLSSHCR